MLVGSEVVAISKNCSASEYCSSKQHVIPYSNKLCGVCGVWYVWCVVQIKITAAHWPFSVHFFTMATQLICDCIQLSVGLIKFLFAGQLASQI